MAHWTTHTAEGLELRQPLAGAGSRLLAAAIDVAIVSVLLLITFVVLWIASSIDSAGPSSFLLGLVVAGAVLLLTAYWAVFEIARGGQTPGKRALGLQVRSLDGGPVAPMQSILRGLFLPVDILPLPLPLGFVLCAATPLAQRLGDFAAGTIVVRLPRELGRAQREPWPGERWSALAQRVLPLTPALAARFTRADVACLRNLLARGEPAAFSDLEPQARRKLYVQAAREFGARVGVERFDDARVVLRELYLFLREMQGGVSTGISAPSRAAGSSGNRPRG